MRKQFLGLLLCTGLIVGAESALAQGYRQADPNMRNFYMGRQQWQVIDDSPVVTGAPGAAAGAAGQGAAPAAPVPLPRAGFVPYSSSIPSVRDALPQVNNGVPKPVPTAPVGPAGMRGKAGNLKPRPAATAPAGPQALKTYTPYKGYGGNTPAPSVGAAMAGGSSASTNVKGSVLHWARPKMRSY